MTVLANTANTFYDLTTSWRKYDFIFFDHYSIIDEDTLEMLDTYVKAAEKILAKDGTILAWFDPYTPEEDAHKFFAILKRATS